MYFVITWNDDDNNTMIGPPFTTAEAAFAAIDAGSVTLLDHVEVVGPIPIVARS